MARIYGNIKNVYIQYVGVITRASLLLSPTFHRRNRDATYAEESTMNVINSRRAQGGGGGGEGGRKVVAVASAL